MNLPPQEEVFKAFNIAQRNAYCRRHTDNEVLFDVFMQGLIYGITGNMPKDALDDIIEKESQQSNKI